MTLSRHHQQQPAGSNAAAMTPTITMTTVRRRFMRPALERRWRFQMIGAVVMSRGTILLLHLVYRRATSSHFKTRRIT